MNEKLFEAPELKKFQTLNIEIFHPTHFPNFFAARAGIYVKDIEEKRLFLGGFSAHTDPKRAVFVAKCEIAERLFALYQYSVAKDPTFPLCSWPDGALLGRCHAREVVLGKCPDGTGGLGSMGLAFHETVEMAAKRAVAECVERYIAARIWYDRIPIFKLPSSGTLPNGLEREDYALALDPVPGFVMSILRTRDNSIWCCGLSLKDAIAEASEKAQEEAMMLFNDACVPGFLNSASEFHHPMIAKRLLSQLDKSLNEERQTYLGTFTVPAFKPSREGEWKDTLPALGLAKADLSYCVLQAKPAFAVVRGLLKSEINLSAKRDQFPEQERLDPIC